MKTKELLLDNDNYDSSIKEAAEILKNDQVVVFPTETVYGIGADIRSAKGLEKIFEVKGRPADNPLIVHISDMEMLKEVAKDIPDKAKLLMREFWPGPLTLVLSKQDNLNDLVTAELDTVGVRMPSNQVAADLIRELDSPIAAPSANISGKPSITSPDYLLEDFNGKVPALLVSKNSEIGIESTVIDMTKEVPVILRPGHINRKQVESVIGKVEYSPGITTGQAPEKPASPGMKYKHYSPDADVILINDYSPLKVKRLQSEGNLGKILLICLSKNKIDIDNIKVKTLQSPEELEKDCYRLLRDADREGFDTVLIELPESNDTTIALIDRLLHASNYKTV